MFCTNCKEARVENEAPCPHCGAPSPLQQISGIGQWGTNNSGGAWSATGSDLRNNSLMNSWGGPANYEARPQAAEAQWEHALTDQSIGQQSPSFQQSMGSGQAWGASGSQLGFDQGAFTSSPLNGGWQQMSPSSQNVSPWQDNGAERQAASQALLPVVYQEPQANEMRQSTVALQLVPQQAIEHLLPEMLEAPERVYVPPLFTNPRPLTPRYRIISGSLSVLIVALLLCGGAGYYAQTSGMLGSVVRMFTGAPPSTQGITSTNPVLANPSDNVDEGPATVIISSGTTTLHINQNNLAVETDKVFTVNQTFYVTYTVQPPPGQDGKVFVKWYMNKQLYRSVPSDKVINGGTVWNGSVPMQYALPAEGSVEIYWNDQLGKRFYFVVQPVH